MPGRPVSTLVRLQCSAHLGPPGIARHSFQPASLWVRLDKPAEGKIPSKAIDFGPVFWNLEARTILQRLEPCANHYARGAVIFSGELRISTPSQRPSTFLVFDTCFGWREGLTRQYIIIGRPELYCLNYDLFFHELLFSA